MSYKERRDRKDEAAAASARFAVLEALIAEEAALRVVGPRMLADGAWLAGRGLDRDVLAAAADLRLAWIAERLEAFREDAPVLALAEAAVAVGWPGALTCGD